MSDYQIRWITEQLAVGHAPMSYRDLDDIRAQGISAIVNLCGEYCDLHELEAKHGFEVYYLPIPDEQAPDQTALEQALDWLDEAVYLGKKVLIHCRFGIGRTGTVVTSYLLRSGFGLKSAKRRLKPIRSAPTSFSQWRLLRRVGKQEKPLVIREPSLEAKHVLDLAPYFAEYRELARRADRIAEQQAESGSAPAACGRDTAACCGRLLWLQFIEAAHLSHCMNRFLAREQRQAAVARAVEKSRALAPPPAPTGAAYRCPLSVDDRCILFEHRPLACRLYGLARASGGATGGGANVEDWTTDAGKALLHDISRDLFLALNGAFLDDRSLLFPLPHVVSGKFIQDYFLFLKTGAT